MSEIYIIDRIVAKQGQALAVRDAYIADYAPGARARGLTLRSQLISPPFVLKHDRSNTLCFTWSLGGAEAWWKLTAAAQADKTIMEFWRRIAPLIVHRERSYYGDAANV